MTHLIDNQSDELNDLLINLRKKKIYYKIKIRAGVIIELDTMNKELLAFAKKNNKDLK